MASVILERLDWIAHRVQTPPQRVLRSRLAQKLAVHMGLDADGDQDVDHMDFFKFAAESSVGECWPRLLTS